MRLSCPQLHQFLFSTSEVAKVPRERALAPRAIRRVEVLVSGRWPTSANETTPPSPPPRVCPAPSAPSLFSFSSSELSSTLALNSAAIPRPPPCYVRPPQQEGLLRSVSTRPAPDLAYWADRLNLPEMAAAAVLASIRRP